jgi:hypothetical protein
VNPVGHVGGGPGAGWHEPSACGTWKAGQHDSPPLSSWPSGHADANDDPLADWADWHVPSYCGVDDEGQQVPKTVSCASRQDAARPPPGSWQVSSPVGVEPAAQQARPSAVTGPGQAGAAHEPSACGD